MATRTVETYDQTGKLTGTRQEFIPDEQANVESITTRLSQLISTLEDADARWTQLTAAQKDAAQRAVVVSAAKLARLVLSRFDKD